MKSDHRHNRPSGLPTFKDNRVEYGREDARLHIESEANGVECYSFRINSPNCKKLFRDTKHYDNRANRSFFARAYWRPPGPKSHIVIMYNGLDETIYTTSEHLFDFYDQLGLRLASAGKLAIFLPTPYHMNRALSYVSAEKGEELARRHRDRFIRMHIPSEALTSAPWRM